MARAAFFKKIKADFGIPKLSEREFLREWGHLATDVAPAWTKGGRPKRIAVRT
jgi:hypothetical protein